MIKKKKAQIGLYDALAGVVVIAGGLLIFFSNVNLGSLVTSFGLLLELIKIVLKQGP